MFVSENCNAMFDENEKNNLITNQDRVEAQVEVKEQEEPQKIRGWLTFFLIVLGVGAISSVITTFATLKIEDYSNNIWYVLVDVFFVIAMLCIAFYTITAFRQRRANAMFWAYVYFIFIILSNIVTVVFDHNIKTESLAIRGIFGSIIWILYLSFSKQVKRRFPKSFCKVSKVDRSLLIAFIVVPIVLFVVGTVKLFDVSKESEIPIDATELSENQRTDGRVVFTIPQGFTCSRSEVDGIMVYTLEDENGSNCTICSDYEFNPSWSTFDAYWETCKGADVQTMSMTNVDKSEKKLGNTTCFYRTVVVDYNGIDVYWRFYLIFHDLSNKVCLLSCYDAGDSSYVNEILESIRF